MSNFSLALGNSPRRNAGYQIADTIGSYASPAHRDRVIRSPRLSLNRRQQHGPKPVAFEAVAKANNVLDQY